MERNTKYPTIKYNDLLISRIVIWQIDDDWFCIMHWPETHRSEFVMGFSTYDAAQNYLNKEFKPTQVPL